MAKLTLAPMDVVLSADGRTLHVARAGTRPEPQPERPAKSSRKHPDKPKQIPVKIIIPTIFHPTAMTAPVWTTFLTDSHRDRHAPDFSAAPGFASFEDLAKRAPAAFGARATGGPVFARVRAAGAVPMDHIDEALAALPEDAELIVGVEWDRGQ